MKILVLVIGKLKSRPIQLLADDYIGRLSHYLKVELVTCRDEAKALARLDPSDYLVMLDERGKEFTSTGFSKFISENRDRGLRRMVLFIGGPDGIGDEMRARADAMLALSKMTFTHEMAQVLLLEQLYRACTIMKGEPYHK
jgi:23S rRNA (pseudouridine1915-N3)-methyltransferase